MQSGISTAVHMTRIFVREQCPLLCIALISCLSKLPIACSNFSFSCTACVLYCHIWLPQCSEQLVYLNKHVHNNLVLVECISNGPDVRHLHLDGRTSKGSADGVWQHQQLDLQMSNINLSLEIPGYNFWNFRYIFTIGSINQQ